MPRFRGYGRRRGRVGRRGVRRFGRRRSFGRRRRRVFIVGQRF